MPDPCAPRSLDRFRTDIEGMRGLAVLVVILFHAGLLGIAGGFVGVDVFFVISGYLITGLLVREQERTGTISLLQFYARRGRRLIPAALVVLLVTLFAALNLVAPLDRADVGLDGAAAAISIGNVRFAMAAGDYFTSVTAPSPFLHFWSLAVEEQFYLVWPALILIVARGLHARRRVMIALVAITAASFLANLVITDLAANWAFYSLPTRAWQLGLGGLLAVGVLSRVPGWVLGLAGWIGLAAICASVMAFDAGLAYPGVAAALPSIGAVALLAGGSYRLGPGRLMSVRPLRFLGRISYSLYLVHWPILVLAPLAIGRAADEPTRVGLVVLSVAVAYICWALIETPFRTGLPSLALRPGRTVSFGLAAVFAVVVIAAGPSIGVPPVDTAAAAEAVASLDAGPDVWIDDVPTPSPVAAPTVTPTVSATGTLRPDPTATVPPVPPVATPVPDVANSGVLPADVKPALAKARRDEDKLRSDGCLAFERTTDPPDCAYGDKDGTYVVALVGDSHAAHWFPALERLAKHEGWKVVTFVKVSCPFIDMPVRNLALKREYRECAAFNEATIARLTSLGPDLTLVSMSRISTRPMRGGDDNVAAKAAAIGRMLTRIPGRTVVITDTPFAKSDVPGCLSSHQGDIEACAIPRKTAFTDSLGDVEVAAAAAGGAGLVDLTSRICVGEGACSVVVNGLIVFRDEGHMTATFSRSLAPALGAAIAAAIGD